MIVNDRVMVTCPVVINQMKGKLKVEKLAKRDGAALCIQAEHFKARF